MSGETVEKESKIIKLDTAPKSKLLTPEQEARLAAAKKELAELSAGVKDKKYAIGISSEESRKVLIDFVSKKAKWKFTESLGIIETLKTLRKETIKSGAMLMGALEIEAIYYFMSKHEGTGESDATEFHKILKPITDALAKLREDAQHRQLLEARISGLEQGLDLAEDKDAETTTEATASEKQ